MKTSKFKNVKIGQSFYTDLTLNPNKKYIKMSGKTGFNGNTIEFKPSYPVFVKGSVLD